MVSYSYIQNVPVFNFLAKLLNPGWIETLRITFLILKLIN